jgi:hypothetical protein
VGGVIVGAAAVGVTVGSGVAGATGGVSGLFWQADNTSARPARAVQGLAVIVVSGGTA